MANADLKKWGKRAAFVGVFGITGLVVIGAINLYRFSKGIEMLTLDGENWYK